MHHSLQRNHAIIALTILSLSGPAFGVGAILNKSGPIQITADGQFVWVVNPDHDSVSRLRTSDNAVTQYPLPASGERQNPQGLAILPNGSEVWIACHDSNRVYVLNAGSGAVMQSFTLPYGSGPMCAAISPNGAKALVALHRSGAIAVFDTATRTLTTIIEGLFRHPFTIAFTGAGNEAWVAHSIGDGEPSYLTRLDTAADKVAARINLQPTGPQQASQITGDPNPIPEGGYFLLRSNIAQRPGSNHLWVPSQHQNLHNPNFTPDSSIQAAVHKIDLTTQQYVTGGRVILTAVTAHNTNGAFIGPGWNAHICGPIDIAFNAAGTTAYLVNTYSNDVLVFGATIGMARSEGAAALPEINVGDHPIGIAVSPATERAYVLNHLSRDVSVINLTTLIEEARIPITPGTPEPLAANILTGARIFNSSVDPRISANQKVACASCHPGGEMDGLIWSFAPLGAGNRKTFHLLGQGLSFAPQMNGRGQLHRSGDRDEVQDFDLTFRGPIMGGTGFLPADNPTLGAPNGGLNADLDALAAFVLNLPALRKSPFRAADGALTESARRGATIFNASSPNAYAVGCKTCHPSPNFTDLGFHAVGGQAPAPENEGPNFNSPSLVGAWDTGPYAQTIGFRDSQTLGGIVRKAHVAGSLHGNTSQLNRTHMRDLETFLNSIDGAMAQIGSTGVVDLDPPRVVSVQPVSLNAVEVIFNETVDAATAGNAANYVFTDGHQTLLATAATLNTSVGNRVRVAVALAYHGCPVTYMLLPGPIRDVAGSIGGGAGNTLDVTDPANRKTLTLNGSITVTFGDIGNETFTPIARDASFDAAQANISYTHLRLFPGTSPETKGFVLFDFIPTLTGQCGVASSASILDARFTALPTLGFRNALELHRCLMPWGDPPNDFCNACSGAVTRTYSRYATTAWHAGGAAAYGGAGTNASEYYPTGSFDLASTIDATAQIAGLTERVEFSGAQVTSAFRFWFDNPTKNFGYGVEVAGNNNNQGTDFWSAEAEDGKYGLVLSITFAIAPTPGFTDCNGNTVADECDIAGGASQDANGDGIPDECQLVTLASANPPNGHRDVLQNTTAALVAQGIGAAGTPDEGTLTFAAPRVTFSGTPVPAPAPANIGVSCTGGPCPSVAAVAGSAAGPYVLTLNGGIPILHCTTLTFAGTVAGQKLQYAFLPGDVNGGGQTTGQDVLALVGAINSAATIPSQHDVNRNGLVSGQDVLRLVQLLNGSNATQSFNGSTVAACP